MKYFNLFLKQIEILLKISSRYPALVLLGTSFNNSFNTGLGYSIRNPDTLLIKGIAVLPNLGHRVYEF